MNTNCPHCNGKIVVQTNCCIGDEAITGICTLAEHEKARKEQEEKDHAKETRKVQFNKALEDYMLQKTGMIFRVMSKLDIKTESILLSLQNAGLIWVIILAIILVAGNKHLLNKHSLIIISPVIPCGIITVCLCISNAIFFIWKNVLKRFFLAQHPEFKEFK